MQKQAPTFGRLMVMVLFALSCFGLLLFLWLAFGGPIPLKPQGYRFQVAVPEANQLAVEAEVRTAGVAVGKIREKRLAPGGNRTLVTIELDERFAPLDADARVIMRAKTLLGEKYLEVTPGRPGGPDLPEGGRLPDAQVERTIELDQILNALDERTQRLYRTWQQDLGKAIRGRGATLNDAFGNLPRFAAGATDVLTVLDDQEGALRKLVRNTGQTFEAITADEAQLRNLVVNADQVFEATSREREALAETFRIFPTFLDESRITAADLESFSRQTRPLLRDLRPALQDLRPTLEDVRRLAPDLKAFYQDLDPLIEVSKAGLPALRDVLKGLEPVLGQIQPFVEELNPALEFLEYQQHGIADFIQNGGGALVDTVPGQRDGLERGHYLGQFGITGSDTVILSKSESASTRGNAYPDATMLIGKEHAQRMINSSWDCDNAPEGKEYTTKKGDTSDVPSCWIREYPGLTRFPQLTRADYSKAVGRAWPPEGR